MLIISLGKRIRRLVLLAAGLFVIGMVVFQAAGYQKDKEPARVKVDRSTALEVTKPISQEQIVSMTMPDFFTEYRLEREKIRSERFDVLREMMKSAKTEDAKQRVQETILKLVLDKQREYEMENLIKARGFQDALVVIQDRAVNAIVKTQSFSREEVAQVADVIRRISGVRPEDITISAKP